jgi:hypothetical protein
MKRIAILLALLLVAIAFAGGHTVQDATTALAAQGVPGERWSFVAIADTQPYLPFTYSPDFPRAISEINVLHPDLVVDSGDCIFGYSKDDSMTNRWWDAYFKLVGRATVPWFPVVGNHDITTPAHAKIYTSRVGPLYYSFTYGRAFFLCLCTEEPGFATNISPTQLQWIRDQLTAATGAHMVFVFMHEPLWLLNPTAWQPVHDLLKAHPAVTKACFAGHIHLYTQFPDRDGIQYTIAGGGGGVTGDQPQAGDFHHYLFVQVNGDKAVWSVIRPGSIDPPNVVTAERSLQVRAISSCVGDFTAAGDQRTAPATVKLSLRVKNTTRSPLRVEIAWDGLAYCDAIDPEDFATQIPAGEDRTLQFTLTARNPVLALHGLRCFATLHLPEGQGEPVLVRRVAKFNTAPGVHVPDEGPAAPEPAPDPNIQP